MQVVKKDIKIPQLKKELYSHQKESIKYFVNKERIIIADEMGTGKTAQAIACIEQVNAFPCLVICPASLKYNWQNEINAWTNRKSTIGVDSCPEYTIINYDILEKNKRKLIKYNFKSIICDESHYLKNAKAMRTRVVRDLATNIPYKILLTGTPCLNRPVELVSQLEILDQLQNFGDSWSFRKRYCGAYHNGYGWQFNGATNIEELNQLLRDTCYIRRKKDEVLDLPLKTKTIIQMQIDNIDEYNKATKNFKQWLMEQGNAVTNAIHLTKIEKLKQLAVKGKMKQTIQWIKDFLESGEKLVVFANHIEIQDILLRNFPCAATIRGESDAITRQHNVERFQHSDDCRLIISSLAAGGVGITLTAASNVAFIELGWTPGIHSQAEDRCHRIGQYKPVNVWYLISKNTIEEKIYNLIQEKGEITSKVHDGILQKLIEEERK